MIYHQLVEETIDFCKIIELSPVDRLLSRKTFYEKLNSNHGLSVDYGVSELAFLEWEIERGVLGSEEIDSSSENKGSMWWKAVNIQYIFYSELAYRLYENDLTEFGLSNEFLIKPVKAWLKFFREPNSINWYRAHNTSILYSFNKFRYLAELENETEIEFINIALYRLLYAQALAEGKTKLGNLGEVLAHPEGWSVDLIIRLSHFYPPYYPFSSKCSELISGKKWSFQGCLIRVLDNKIILPSIGKLYKQASIWNNSPFLESYLLDGKPFYPSLDKERDKRSPQEISTLLSCNNRCFSFYCSSCLQS